MKAKRKPDLDDLSRAIDNDMATVPQGFPREVFPKAIQDLIDSAKETKGFDKDYFSAGILSICATAIGNTVSLYNGSYKAKPILWMAIIGSRGTGKTHPLDWAIEPINMRDEKAYIEYQQKMQDWETQDKESKGKKPKLPKYILKDFTPEKLAETLQHNEKGVLIFQDELMRWVNSFDQYKKGGDQQMYLDLFNGSELTVDRVTKEPIRIKQTNVNILGGMQPEIVKGLAGNNRSEDGFLDRFLFVYPENLEPHLFTGHDIAEVHRGNYLRLVNNLLDAPEQLVKANASNIEIFKTWQHAKASDCFNDTLERALQAKMETYVWRLALIIEMMHQAANGNYNTSLQDKNLNRAITLVEYFRLNALRVHDRILSKNPLEGLTTVQQDLYITLPPEFKRADVLPLFDEKGIKGGTVDRFLKNEKLFENVKYGHYKKRYKGGK